MDLATALTQFNPYIASPEQLAIQIAAWAEQAKQLQQNADLVAKQRQEIHLKDSKIAALTFELAYHKRLKFGAKTEAFTSEQRDLFHESAETDLVAIEAELAQLTPAAPRTKPTGRKALPADLPRIEHRHEPERATAVNAVMHWCRSVKISVNNSMSNQRVSLCIVISVRNTLAALAKR